MAKRNHLYWIIEFFLLLIIFVSCSTGQAIQDLSINWRLSKEDGKTSETKMEFVLVNSSASTISLDQWSLWFNAIYPVLDTVSEDYIVTNEKGNLYQITFSEGRRIGSQDSLVVQITSKYAINNVSAIPNGLYFQNKENASFAFDVKIYNKEEAIENSDIYKERLAKLFEKNLKAVEGFALDILPTPTEVVMGVGEWIMPKSLSYSLDPNLGVYKEKLENALKNLPEIASVTEVEATERVEFVFVQDQTLEREAYRLQVADGGVQIFSSGYEGMFYAIQSIRSLIKPHNSNAKEIILPYIKVEDEPRFPFRGQMIDIARNFHSKELILKYLDIMSFYKLNVFHLHFIDDEGWRIEIPSLPELTSVGSNRTAFFEDGYSIQPAYGSGVSAGKHKYLSVDDFKEILTYAADRCIRVIPEIETPGHARAAIKAMESRYKRLMREGKKAEAEEYLLHDPEDKSIYSSVQYFDDNVMDVARPSTYAFLSLVVDEIKQMYEDVGLELTTIHMGGDEVPDGVWSNSPSIKKLMDEQGYTSELEIWPYYINRIRDMLQDKGIQMEGWEEIGMVNKGEGMDVNIALPRDGLLVDVWNNVIGAGQEDLAYRLANAGYKTVLVSSSNFYLDMAWNTEFHEPGFKWASHTDLYHSYSLLPHNYFANVHLADRAKSLAPDYFDSKVRLTPEGEKNIIGIKGALWSENISSDDRVDYMLLPRILSVAERAWSAKRAWETEQAFDLNKFDAEYNLFVNKIGRVELPKLDAEYDSLNYRMPSVGVKIIDGNIHVNTEMPGFSIHYTTDGSDPTINSPVYTIPIALDAETVYKFVTSSPKGRLGRVVAYSNTK